MKLKQVVVMIGLLLMVALLAGCQPITAEGMMSALAGQPVEDASAMVGEQAMATVTARSLRVRAEPSDSAEVVTGIREGEQFPVIGRSSDGLWIQLDIPPRAGRQWLGIRQLRDGAGSDHRCRRQQRTACRHRGTG